MVTILLVIFFGVLFFMGTVVLELINWATKTAKFLSTFFLSIIYLEHFIIYITYLKTIKNKEEIAKIYLICLNSLDDFEIIKKKEDWDLTYNRTNLF